MQLYMYMNRIILLPVNVYLVLSPRHKEQQRNICKQ